MSDRIHNGDRPQSHGNSRGVNGDRMNDGMDAAGHLDNEAPDVVPGNENSVVTIAPPQEALARLRGECGDDDEQMQEIGAEMTQFYMGMSNTSGANYSDNLHLQTLKKWVAENLTSHLRGECPRHELKPAMFVAQRLTHPTRQIDATISTMLQMMGHLDWYSVRPRRLGQVDMAALEDPVREANETTVRNNAQSKQLKETIARNNAQFNELKETTVKYNALFNELKAKLEELNKVLGDHDPNSGLVRGKTLYGALNYVMKEVKLTLRTETDKITNYLRGASFSVTEKGAANPMNTNQVQANPPESHELRPHQLPQVAGSSPHQLPTTNQVNSPVSNDILQRDPQAAATFEQQQQATTASTNQFMYPVETEKSFTATAPSTTPTTPAKRPLSTTRPTDNNQPAPEDFKRTDE